MKLIVPFALFMAVGFILAAGCVAMTNKNTVNATTAASFAPFSNTSDPGLNKTINATANSSSKLKGSLRVSISGILYPANLSVVLDNETVGTVKPTTPLYLMVSEGNHTVMVCVSSVCEQENVMTRFGRYMTVDFSERLQKDVEFPNPTARPTAQILDYYKSGEFFEFYFTVSSSITGLSKLMMESLLAKYISTLFVSLCPAFTNSAVLACAESPSLT